MPRKTTGRNEPNRKQLLEELAALRTRVHDLEAALQASAASASSQAGVRERADQMQRHSEAVSGCARDMERYAAAAKTHAEERAQAAVLLEQRVRDRTAELERSERRVTDILEGIQDGFFSLDREWRFTYVNERAAKNLGCAPVDLIGQNLWDRFPELVGTLHEKTYRQVMEERVPARFEISGVLTPASYDIRVYPSAEGISVYWLDITERRRMEEEVKQLYHDLEERAAQVEAERARWQSVVDGIADEVWLADAEGKMSLINVPEATVMGLEEFADRTVAEVYEQVDIMNLDGQVRPLQEAPLLRALKGEVVRGEEIMRHRKTGRTRYRQYSAAPTRNADGAITGSVAIVRDVTEQKQMEQALAQSEARFRSLFQGLPYMTLIYQKDGPEFILTDYNDAAAIQTQGGLAALVGQTVREIYRDRPDLIERFERSFVERTTLQYATPYRYVTTGEDKYIVATFAYVPPDRVMLHVQDITESKRAQDALHQALAEAEKGRQTLQALMESVPQGITIADADENIQMVSRFGQELLGGLHTGMQVQEVADRWRIYEKDGITPMKAEDTPLSRAIREGRAIHDVELVEINSEGQALSLLCSAAPIRDHHGRITGGVVAWQDITERKRAEEALHKTWEDLRLSEERFRTALRHAPIAVYNQDCDLNFTWAFNPWGIDSTDLTGKQAEQILPHHEPTLDAIKRRVIETGVGTRQEVSTIALDGREHSYDFTVDPLHDAAGQIIGVTCAAIDVTEYQQAKERIEQLNRELEQRAVQLEITNQELESFSYSVSHDLRTPLASVDGFARLLQDDYGSALPEQAQRYLGFLQASSQQMGQLIASLLSLSRLNRQSLKKQRVNMSTLVMEALGTLREEPARQDLTLDVHDLQDADADPVLLKQVWVNLISNALKFTRKCDKALIEIGCGPCDGADRVYYIRDNGVGFDMEQAGQLFGVFQRLHGEDEYEGTGVGLAIVQRIIHRHGGRVWAEAEVDKGATFYFTLD